VRSDSRTKIDSFLFPRIHFRNGIEYHFLELG
jgi:hypothetical protein